MGRFLSAYDSGREGFIWESLKAHYGHYFPAHEGLESILPRILNEYLEELEKENIRLSSLCRTVKSVKPINSNEFKLFKNQQKISKLRDLIRA